MPDSLLHLFPIEKRPFWSRIASDQKQIQEIRLREGQPILIWKQGQEWYLDKTGNYTTRIGAAHCTLEGEVGQILQHICQYSVYAYEDELRQGYLTAAGGHRVGIAGQAVLEDNGAIRTIKHISYMNIRVAHQVKGAGDKVLPLLYRQGELLNTLIISPPGCGKTTLLRDLVRQVSDGNQYAPGKCVGLVDERSEIAGCFQGRPQNDVGMRTDVLDACPKAMGMMLLLRAMAPQVIAIDELGGEEDMTAVHMAASCGSRILATIHGDSMEDISHKAGMERLLKEGLFQRFIILGKQNGHCTINGVFGKEKVGDSTNRKYYGGGRLYGAGSMVSPAISVATSPSALSE